MKQKERTVWTIAVIALLGVIVVGRNGVTQEADGEQAGLHSGSSGRTTGNSLRSGDDSTWERRTRDSQKRPDSTALGVLALRSEDPLERMSNFLQALSSSDAASIAKLRATLAAMKAEGQAFPAEESLLEFRAGQLEGAALLAGRTGSREDAAEIETVRKHLEGWASTDRAAAANWVESLPAGKYRDQLAVSYLTTAAKHDPEGSMQLVASLHPSQQAAAGRATAKALAETASVGEVTGILNTMELAAGDEGRGYLSAMFDTLVAESGGNSLGLVESNLDRSYVTAASLARVSSAKAKNDPAAALDWAASIGGRKGLDQGQLLTAAVGGMDLEGLNRAEEWAAAHWGKEGVDTMWAAVLRNRNSLENRGDDINEYDKDD